MARHYRATVPNAVSRNQVLGFRVRAQQLDREHGVLADTAVLDLGVQDTGPDGGLWALAVRGVDVHATHDELATVWTVRGAPHLYRRADLPGVAAATAPFSDADAGKRIYDASKPLKAAGIGSLEALDAVAGQMREIVTVPTVKGEMSRRLAERMPAPYLRFCRPCNATHLYEMPFRLAALRAGLELQPGTSPPVLEPIPGFAPDNQPPDRLDVVRGYLRLLGPATPQHVAGYLDAPVKDVKARWPADAVEVDVDGERRWLLADDLPRVHDEPPAQVRLLGPFDLFLQARDRELLVPQKERATTLWPVLGRPGGVLAGGAIVGSWRPRKVGAKLTVTVQLWESADDGTREGIEEEAQRLAAFRGATLAKVEITT
jgi:Winged helix DNA-binding domain